MLSGGRVGITARREGSEWAEVSVTDDGCGIPEDLRTQIFAPFFTTKLSHKNTGLGLSICRNILEEHGGTISFDSKPGSGTTFKICIPTEQHQGNPS